MTMLMKLEKGGEYGERYMPRLICEACGQEITKEKPGNAFWKPVDTTGDEEPIRFIHKGHCHDSWDQFEFRTHWEELSELFAWLLEG